MHAANEVIVPALGISQATGKIIRWLIAEGQPVTKGEPLLEIETDKAVDEIEAPATGILRQVTAQPGDEIPVGTVIATILPAVAPGAATSQSPAGAVTAPAATVPPSGAATPPVAVMPTAAVATPPSRPVTASPLAARIAAEHNLDLALVRPEGGHVKQADVLAYLEAHEKAPGAQGKAPTSAPASSQTLASPKARRLAAERGLNLAALKGSGPEGAVLAADVLAQGVATPAHQPAALPAMESAPGAAEIPQSKVWRIMAERTTAAWREAPHFFLMRDVDATRLSAWREAAQPKDGVKVTYTDLLVRVVAAALRRHPRVNAVYQAGTLRQLPEINIGVAVAVGEGLVVPIIQKADAQGVAEIARARTALVEKARAGRLRPEDISGGTFTISNLGMYGVDAFLAILNPPQSAILAVGRIVERVVPVRHRPAVRPMMTLSLSFDHRAVDGALGAQFLDSLAKLLEEPLGLLG